MSILALVLVPGHKSSQSNSRVESALWYSVTKQIGRKSDVFSGVSASFFPDKLLYSMGFAREPWSAPWNWHLTTFSVWKVLAGWLWGQVGQGLRIELWDVLGSKDRKEGLDNLFIMLQVFFCFISVVLDQFPRNLSIFQSKSSAKKMVNNQ